MKFSHYFVQRPIFATVLSVLIVIAGFLSFFQLPVSEYPEVVPPTVVVNANYPGASPDVVAETVAGPIEQAVNGVENMLYMASTSTSNGGMQLTITFQHGTDPDKAQVQVQNRVDQALPRLPEAVQRLGVVTQKSSPNMTMVVHLVSPDKRYDPLYLSNYAARHIKDQLARLPGVGDVPVWGGGDYSMRIWLQPTQLIARGLTASDVVQAIREQNIQVAAGALGQEPDAKAAFQLSIKAQGRLKSPEEFGHIIVSRNPSGAITYLRDVARIELGADRYAVRSYLNGEPAIAMAIIQRPDANSLELAQQVRSTMATLKQSFPEDIDYRIAYDPTIFVKKSIESVVQTLFEAMLLVVLVVVLFLKTWRASIIPLVAVPVSLIGTFAIMHAFGFSLNNLSLFGLVLAIGIVVDDAIVVVENVERNLSLGLTPVDATRRAMSEVTGPIIATALVLCAVFVPTAFISGLSGQFYSQFALTIAISTIISAFNSLTLSPALAAALLRQHDSEAESAWQRLTAFFFRRFDAGLALGTRRYGIALQTLLRRSGLVLVAYAGLLLLTFVGFNNTSTGFVPMQDKYYLVGMVQLPEAASLDRTDEVTRRLTEIALAEPGVESVVAFPGISINGFATSSSSAVVFVMLDPFEQRRDEDLSAFAIAYKLNGKLSSIQEGFLAMFPPPPVFGLGTIGGFKLQVEDRSGLGAQALAEATQALIAGASKEPGIVGLFSGYQSNVPQLQLDVDRTKAKSLGVPLTSVYETMQIQLGSLYVNDFNLFGRTYPVIVQADAPYRQGTEAVSMLRARNDSGQLVPLNALVKLHHSAGPDRVSHYNGYPSADINGATLPGVSSGQAIATMERVARDVLPAGMAIEWTELTYQQIQAGNTAGLVFLLSVLLVFLVLAAQYESWSLPLAIILIVPMTLLSALVGVWLSQGDNNIFTQIGLLVLVGLASKNAILIVEFARAKEEDGMALVPAVLEAARLRLRPILMTSLAFIMGVFPLVIADGAGAEMRQAMGVAVFAGMLGLTLFGLLLTPVFYVVVRSLEARFASRARYPSPSVASTSGVES